MNNKEFTKVLKKASNMAHDHLILLSKIDKESKKRHGFTPSEIDCDPIIDIIMYSGGLIDSKSFDKDMKEAIGFNTDHEGNVSTI